MRRVDRKDLETVRQLIEQYRLTGLLEMIAWICGENAQTAREQWRDKELAATWDRDALACDKLRAFVSD